ncbi:hypothetical protein EK21DRAFT_116779 [Setomelanomma holmii]|uniref:PHD-type domain-containing protein n=1 Tax=Setomelanomma holmii TaxID=210430 RepID=A0A9P4H0A0_9PLEO|nr:hypothetical protein EK21DRAFT_116779 [Setomelanomma holmii]
MADRAWSSRQAHHQGNRSRISPPPTKRQRTAPEAGHSNLSKPTVSSPIRQSSFVDETQRRWSNHGSGRLRPYIDESCGPLDSSESTGQSFDSAYSSDSQARRRLELSRNSNRHGESNPHRLSSSSSSSDPYCRGCGKTASVRYDPIIACSSCHRQYHDSCRSPPLISGVDPRRWRCLSCLKDEPKHPFPAPKVPRAFLSSSPATSVRKLPHGRQPDLGTTADQVSSDLGSKNGPEPRDNVHDARKVNIQRLPVSKPHVNERTNEPSSVDGSSEVENKNLLGHFDAGQKGWLGTSNPRHGASSPALSTDVRPGQAKGRDIAPRAGFAALKPHVIRQTEVPKTPTQSSSQFESGDSIPRVENAVIDSSAKRDDSALINELPRVAKPVSPRVLCRFCRKQPLVGKGTCLNCKKRSVITESARLEIQETPDPTSTTGRILPVGTDSTSLPSGTVTIPTSTSQPTPWFELRLVDPNSAKVKEKVGLDDDMTPDLDFTFKQTSSSSNDQCPSNIQNADTSCQPYIVRPEGAIGTMTGMQGKPIKVSDEHDALAPHAEHQDRIIAAHKKISTFAPDCSNADSVEATISISVGKSPELLIGEAPSTITSQHIAEQSIPLDCSDGASKGTSALFVGSPSGTSNASTEKPSESSDSVTANRQYTNRQLAQIALVAANGCHMTTSQIIIWLAHEFTHLRVGGGSWEMSLRSVLSSSAEFEGRKIAGDLGNKKLYGFASKAFRARFEKEHSEYCGTSNILTASKARSRSTEESDTFSENTVPQKHHLAQNRKAAKKSAPSLPKRITSSHQLHTSTQTMLDVPSKPLDEQENEKGSRIDPSAKRSKPREALMRLDFDFGVSRQAKFVDTLDRSQQENGQIMSINEKARKLAEIKSRPSRKKYFGSDHRLAHKRGYGLGDIHDERDGAWIPMGFERDQNTIRPQEDEEEDMEDAATRTLRQVFGLPENIIPMNDEQTELAFRDGTLVNGRLPRPRNVYRVGKMVGGELTVRTL